jgi:type I restriction enzyme, S subunit
MKVGWEKKQLGDIAQIKGGKRVPKGYKLLAEPTAHPYITVSDFTEDGTIDLSNLRYISDEVFSGISRYTISSDDLYISIAGTIGKTGIIPPELDGANLTENACKLIFESGVSKEFIYYFTVTDDFMAQAGTNTRVAAQPKLALERLKTISLPLPPLPEQQRIVAILDEAFEGIAIAKANAEKNLQNARALFESHVNEVFTTQGKGWVVKTLDQISTNLDSKRIPITKSDRKSGEYPYYGASGIVDYVADYIFDGDTLLVSEDGANLLARSTPIAFSVSGKYWVNNHAHILKFENKATQRFVEFYLESIRLDEYITGAAQPKLNQKALYSIPIPIPNDVDEQARVVESIELLAGETQRLESIYQQKLAALDALKKSLLDQAFRGEL